ncbi:MAG: D-alanyl-D-alanine carboxypeptidase/D-alanyl-D-alanine-endopeptidase [Phycisphaerales bacterium]|nr:D-alanyl-D-alanine carboxypeptidase/D-alanyl-D-alanine-endopeptidase [Phycisphaerales bacterium]
MPRSSSHKTVLLSLVALAFASTASADLEREIRAAIGSSGSGKSIISVSIRNAEDGSELVEIRDDRPMIPASNMKLFTSGAALHRLGTDFFTRTEMRLDDDTLWLVGGGDPALGDPVILENTTWVTEGNTQESLDVDLLVDLMVDTVLMEGVTELDEMIVDDRIFDRVFFHPDWPVDQLDKWYCAEVAGINLHLNVLTVHMRPGTGSRPVLQRTEPRVPWLTPSIDATNRQGKKDATKIGISRPAGSNQLRIYGNIGEPIAAEVTLTDMPATVVELMRNRLAQAGISVGTVRLATSEDLAPSGRLIKPTLSTPISVLLERCNTNSHNLYAEALCKLIGHDVENEPGSWENGTRAVRMVVRDRIGAAFAQAFQQADGSGLSRNNKVTAELITAWLASFHQDDELGPTFFESLAVAGSTGSVSRRCRDLPDGIRVDCKTGHINGVSCLSGVVRSESGECLAFSVLCNQLDPKFGTTGAKRLQDRIVGLLADRLAPARTAIGSN